METNQDVPEFLSAYKPDGGDLNFDEEEEQAFEDTAAGGAGEENGDAWGAGGDGATPAPVVDAWGASGDAAHAPAEAWGANNGGGDAAGAAAW